MVRDALDETGKNLLRLILGRVFHTLERRQCGLKYRGAGSARQLIRLPARSAWNETRTRGYHFATRLGTTGIHRPERGRTQNRNFFRSFSTLR